MAPRPRGRADPDQPTRGQRRLVTGDRRIPALAAVIRSVHRALPTSQDIPLSTTKKWSRRSKAAQLIILVAALAVAGCATTADWCALADLPRPARAVPLRAVRRRPRHRQRRPAATTPVPPARSRRGLPRSAPPPSASPTRSEPVTSPPPSGLPPEPDQLGAHRADRQSGRRAGPRARRTRDSTVSAIHSGRVAPAGVPAVGPQHRNRREALRQPIGSGPPDPADVARHHPDHAESLRPRVRRAHRRSLHGENHRREDRYSHTDLWDFAET